MSERDLRLVRQSLRERDFDRYISALFAPRDSRNSLYALYAANAEMARVGRVVSEPILGDIRLQWWRDSLDNAEIPSGNPVADALARTIRERGLDSARISELIDARSFDVTGDRMPDMRALRTYFGKSEGAVFSLAAEILGAEAGRSELDAMTEKAAIAYGITRMLLTLPRDLAERRILIPRDLLASIGADDAPLHSDEGKRKLAPILSRLQMEARNAVREVEVKLRAGPPRLRLAFLPLALVEPYLELMERDDALSLQPATELSPLRKLWCLWCAT